jgi:hypothetical protein
VQCGERLSCSVKDIDCSFGLQLDGNGRLTRERDRESLVKLLRCDRAWWQVYRICLLDDGHRHCAIVTAYRARKFEGDYAIQSCGDVEGAPLLDALVKAPNDMHIVCFTPLQVTIIASVLIRALANCAESSRG